MGSQVYASEARRGASQGYLIPGFELSVIGGNGPADIPAAGHPLALLAQGLEKLIPKLFKDSLRLGQHTPCLIWKDPHTRQLIVVFGKSRVRAIRDIVTEDGTLGTDREQKVFCIFCPVGTTVQDVLEMHRSENDQRKANDPIETAEWAKGYLRLYGSDRETLERAALICNLTAARLRQLMHAYERASHDLLKAARARQVGVEAFIALAKLSPDEQANELERQGGAQQQRVSASTARGAARRSRGGFDVPGRKVLKADLQEVETLEAEAEVSVKPSELLRYMLGLGPRPEWHVRKQRGGK